MCNILLMCVNDCACDDSEPKLNSLQRLHGGQKAESQVMYDSCQNNHIVLDNFLIVSAPGLYCVVLCCVMLRYVTLHYVTLRCVLLRCVALRCVALRYVTFCYFTLCYVDPVQYPCRHKGTCSSGAFPIPIASPSIWQSLS